VVLTDLEVIIPNLKRNVERNIDRISSRGGNLQVETLDWDDHAEALALGTFEVSQPIIIVLVQAFAHKNRSS
jgi:hypothetical protein